MKNLVLMLFFVFALSSCATELKKPQYIWSHDAKEQGELEQDALECQNEANKHGYVKVGGTGVGAGREEGVCIDKLYRMCMKKKGYYFASNPSTSITFIDIMRASGKVDSGEKWKVSENKNFIVRMLPPPCNENDCKSFSLYIKNKTDKKIEVNWQKTFYIYNGEKVGHFMFEGKEHVKMPDVILPKSSLVKFIYPSNLASKDTKGKWNHKAMPQGENGIDLTIVVDGKEVNEKLLAVLCHW